MGKSRRKEYCPSHRLSKRYQVIVSDFFESEYLYGTWWRRGHSTKTKGRQSLSQLARTIERRTWKKDIQKLLDND